MTFPTIAHYTDLPPHAAALLRAALVINTLATHDLAVALDTDTADIDERLSMLAARGWVEPCPDGGPGGALVWREAFYMWLTWDAQRYMPSSVLHADNITVATRYLDHHLTALTHPNREHVVRWLGAHRDTLLAAINAGIRAGLNDHVIAAAKAAWTVADTLDEAWHVALIHAAEPAARDDRELLDLTRHSADHILRAGHLDTAEHQYCRATRLAFDREDHGSATDALTVLVRIFRDRDQGPRAADALLELADLHQDMGNTQALAVTLIELGEVMLTGDRPELTHIYCVNAIAELDKHPDTSPELLARVHELQGHARWALGNTILARRAFRTALTYVNSGDAVTRERLEVLVQRRQPRHRLSSAHPRVGAGQRIRPPKQTTPRGEAL